MGTEGRVGALVDVLAVLAVGGEDVAVGALAGEAAAGVFAAAVAAEVVSVEERFENMTVTVFLVS